DHRRRQVVAPEDRNGAAQAIAEEQGEAGDRQRLDGIELQQRRIPSGVRPATMPAPRDPRNRYWSGIAASRSRTAPSSERKPHARPSEIASSTGLPSIQAARSAAIAPTRLLLAQCTSNGPSAPASRRSNADTRSRPRSSAPAMGRLS